MLFPNFIVTLCWSYKQNSGISLVSVDVFVRSCIGFQAVADIFHFFDAFSRSRREGAVSQ